MNKDDLVKDLADRFQPKRDAFLADVQNAVHSYIASQGKNCLTLVENKITRKEKWELAASIGYCKRLFALCRGQPYNGNQIDSALTEPTVKVVTERFQKLYEKNENEIGEAVLQLILQDSLLASQIVGSILASAAPAASLAKDRLVQLIVHQLHQFLQTSSGHTLSATIGKTVGGTAAGPVAVKLASIILSALSTKVKVYVAKLFLTGAIKSSVAVAVKKFLLYAIAATIIKAIAVKFGIVVTTSTVAWILVPVILAYITYEVWTFPEHLGKSVSSKIVDDLSNRYREINEEVLSAVVVRFLDTGTQAIADSIGSDEDIQSAIRELLGEFQAQEPSNDEAGDDNTTAPDSEGTADDNQVSKADEKRRQDDLDGGESGEAAA